MVNVSSESYRCVKTNWSETVTDRSRTCLLSRFLKYYEHSLTHTTTTNRPLSCHFYTPPLPPLPSESPDLPIRSSFVSCSSTRLSYPLPRVYDPFLKTSSTSIVTITSVSVFWVKRETKVRMENIKSTI